MVKTNAMRLLAQAGIDFRVCEYEYDENDLNGIHAAERTGMPADQVFKTLVARGAKNGILVFCIPVSAELDLKKAARAAKDKSVEMIHVKELLPLTGYIRGGCSPVGMKKTYPVFMEESALLYDEIGVSAGERGVQMVLDPEKLRAYLNAEAVDLTII
ncbi:MAG: Cys-tRNA(Pro) deacylase [Clostridia bacterium]|nr:Cys-tRNA(Pro) deacylase [Clostridia bacterium]